MFNICKIAFISNDAMYRLYHTMINVCAPPEAGLSWRYSPLASRLYTGEVLCKAGCHGDLVLSVLVVKGKNVESVVRTTCC